MLKNIILSLFCVLTLTTIHAQNKNVYESRYTDVVTKNNLIYALSKTHKLVVWDMNKGDISYIKKEISCIYSNKKNEIYCVTLDGIIQKETTTNQWKKVGAFTGTPFAILTTTTNKIASISSKGLKYNNKYYMPTEKNRIGNGMYSFKNNKLRKPQLAYIDQKDRIWISYDFGKFSEIFIFDTKKSAFLKHKPLLILDEKKTFNSKNDYLKDYRKKQFKKYPYHVKKLGKQYIYKFPTELPLYYGIKSITQDKDGNYFFSEGLAYSHKKNGFYEYLTTIEKKFYKIIENSESAFKKQNEIIGPVVYNNFNGSLYYCSNYGVFKLHKNESGYRNELIIDPNVLLYSKKISHNYGSVMKISKLVFMDEIRFVFLTKQYGFGYYDGDNLNLFN
ncbi:MAG: hypothetical protein HRT69_03355 [Flavobacteriaceae bacterium]|nr:hypothetical protein [Flavobacteriaceae bacterium]